MGGDGSLVRPNVWRILEPAGKTPLQYQYWLSGFASREDLIVTALDAALGFYNMPAVYNLTIARRTQSLTNIAGAPVDIPEGTVLAANRATLYAITELLPNKHIRISAVVAGDDDGQSEDLSPKSRMHSAYVRYTPIIVSEH